MSMIKLKQYRYHVVTSLGDTNTALPSNDLGAINICNAIVIGLNNSSQMSPTGHCKI